MTSYRRLLIAILHSLACTAQIRDTTDRGLNPTGSFSISDIETIDNVNGNLSLSIPIAQLPVGRSADLGALRLVYNSAQFELLFAQTVNNSAGTKKSLFRAFESGFNYAVDYGLVVKSRSAPAPTCSTNIYEETKFFLRMPDGGKKELNLRGQTDTLDGFYGVDQFGRKSCSYGGGTPLTNLVFYTTDGSYLRLVLPADGNQNLIKTWTLTLPSGTEVKGRGDSTEDVTDSNGSKLTYDRTYNPSTDTDTFTIQENLAPYRSVIRTIINRVSSVHTDTISWSGFQQQPLTSKVNWSVEPIGSHGYECQDDGYVCYYGGAIPIVTSIEIPKTASNPVAQKYLFEYRGSANCPSGNSCYGELGKITFPSGDPTDVLTASYEYAVDNQVLQVTNLDNPVKKKTVNYNERTPGAAPTAREEITLIDINSTDSTFTNASGGITKHYFNDVHYGSDPLRGLVFRTDYPDGSRVERLWWRNLPFETALNADPGNPFVRIEVRTLPDSSGGQGATAVSAAKQFTVDRNGNPRKTEEYAWTAFAAPSGGRITGLPAGATLVRTTENTFYNPVADVTQNVTSPADEANAYWNSGAKRHLHALKRSETRDAGSSVRAATEIEYDDFASDPTVPLGNKTKERRWNSERGAVSNPLTTANSAITSYTYTCLGRVATMTDPNGYVTKTEYDANCLFPKKQWDAETRPEERETHFTYDVQTGLVTSVLDYNNSITTSYGYDLLGRRTSSVEGDGSTTETIYDDERRRVISRRDVLANGDGKAITVQHFDTRGLNWLTQEIENGTLPANTDTSSGIKVQRRAMSGPGFTYEVVSNPYHVSGQASMGWTLTRRDAAGRFNQSTAYSGSALPAPWGSSVASVGSTTAVYNGATTTTTDPASKATTATTDSLGRITAALAGGMSTINTYDVLDNLATVTQGSQVRTFNYSSISLLVSATQPENGSTLYSYDKAGNLKSRTDARGWVQKFLPFSGTNADDPVYDGLGRPFRKSIQVAAANSEFVTWNWDPGFTNSRGRLGSVTYGDTTVSYTAYDAAGRVLGHKQTTAGIDYPFSYTYFKNGERKTLTYPSGRVVTYALDIAGRPNTASATARNYVTAATYSSHGPPSQFLLSSGNLGISWPDYNSRLQAETIKVQKLLPGPAVTILNLGYTYSSGADNNGNPRTHTISGGTVSATQTYTYDSANRLATASESGGFTQTYNYDAFNNRWVSPGDRPADYFTPNSSAYYNALTNRSSPTDFQAGYDVAGNMVDQNVSSISYANANTWDAEGRKLSQTLTVNSVPYPITTSFDGLGQRVKKVHATNGTTVYVNDAFGNLAAEYSLSAIADCATCYLFTDILGSTRLVTDANGAVVNRFDFMPFGELIGPGQPWSNGRAGSLYGGASSIKQQFTGSYRDDMSMEWVQDKFGERYLNRAYGRFISPDENLVDQDPADPLSWNLYSYVRNNPLRYVDPTGSKCVTLDNGTRGDDGLPGDGCSASELASRSSVTVTGQPGTLAGAIGIGALIGVSNAANNYFGWMFGTRPATLQNIDPGDDKAVSLSAVIAPFLIPGPKGGAATKLLTGGRARAILTQDRLEHIVFRHWATSSAAGAGKFSPGTTARSLRALIEEAVAGGVALSNTRGRAGSILEYDFGRQIGIDVSGQAATRLRVVLRPDNTVLTAFPIL